MLPRAILRRAWVWPGIHLEKAQTSIRMGYGMFYDQVLNGTYLQNIGTNPPYQETLYGQPGRASISPVANRYRPLRAAAPVVGARTSAPCSQIGTIPTCNNGLSMCNIRLGRQDCLDVGYFGSKGTHLIGAFELNELPPGDAIAAGPTGCAVGASTTPTAPCQVAGTALAPSSAATNILDQIRPYTGYRSITMITPQFNSNYHSFQMSAQHRFTGASQINARLHLGEES